MRIETPPPLIPQDTELHTHRPSGEAIHGTTDHTPTRVVETTATNHTPPLVLKSSHPDSSMTGCEYTHSPSGTTSRCLGTLTIIAHRPQLSTPDDDTAVPVEVRADG
jgi:hypothetical protein